MREELQNSLVRRMIEFRQWTQHLVIAVGFEGLSVVLLGGTLARSLQNWPRFRDVLLFDETNPTGHISFSVVG